MAGRMMPASDFERAAHPRVNRETIATSRAFLPCRYIGNGQGIPGHGFGEA